MGSLRSPLLGPLESQRLAQTSVMAWAMCFIRKGRRSARLTSFNQSLCLSLLTASNSLWISVIDCGPEMARKRESVSHHSSKGWSIQRPVDNSNNTLLSTAADLASNLNTFQNVVALVIQWSVTPSSSTTPCQIATSKTCASNNNNLRSGASSHIKI